LVVIKVLPIDMPDQTTKINKKSNLHGKLFRLIIISSQLSLVLALLILWLFSESVRHSRNLWILFFYNFPSQFLLAIVPHEPVLFYFSKYYHPLTVSVVSVIGTTITEYFNYSIFSYFVEFQSIQKAKKWEFLQKILSLFNKAPFLSLAIAAVSPIPFYPFRFLVVLTKYPLYKYLLAVFIFRFIRYYILALVGYTFHIPDSLLIIIFIVILVIIYLPNLRLILKK